MDMAKDVTEKTTLRRKKCSVSMRSRPPRDAMAVAMLFATLLLAACEDPPMQSQQIQIGAHAFQVEVAETRAQRARGLMGRTELAADAGMLFVFDAPGRHCFWMRDTPLPLSIAFIDDRGRITDLADMAPRDETPHCPSGDVRFALEVRQGEFARHGIRPGMQMNTCPRNAAINAAAAESAGKKRNGI